MLTRHKKRHWMLPAKFPLACWLLIASLDKLVAGGRKQLVETMHCLGGEWSVYSAYRQRLLMVLGCVHIISFLHSLQAPRNSASNYVARIANFSACFFTRSKFNEKNFRCKWTCAQQAEDGRRKKFIKISLRKLRQVLAKLGCWALRGMSRGLSDFA